MVGDDPPPIRYRSPSDPGGKSRSPLDRDIDAVACDGAAAAERGSEYRGRDCHGYDRGPLRGTTSNNLKL